MTLRELELLVALMREQADATGHEPTVTFQDMDARGTPRMDCRVPLSSGLVVRSMTIDSVAPGPGHHPIDRVGDIVVGLVHLELTL